MHYTVSLFPLLHYLVCMIAMVTCVTLSYRQQVSENESEIEKLSEALKKKDEKEKKYQGVILYIICAYGCR